MDCDEIALCEERIEINELDIQLRSARWWQVWVVGKDLHTEGLHPVCDQLTDPTEADNAKSLLE